MRRPERIPHGTITALLVLLGLGLLAPAWVPVPTARAQEEEDLTADLKAARGAFNRARERLENLDFTGASRELSTIIEPRKEKKPADLSAEEETLLCAAYDMRARAQFSLGSARGAEADYIALLHLNPGYVIDRQTLSPKVVDLFDRVRATIAGIVILQVDPARARLRVDGDPVEAQEGGKVPLLAGSRKLRVEADGYDPYEETFVVAAGGTTQKTIRLRPNRRTLQFVTVPAGVTLTIDGQPAGVTAGPPTPETQELARQAGADPQSVSAPLLVPGVTPGDHKVSFDRDCYQGRALSIKVTLDVEQNAPLKFTPVVLQDAKTELRLTSHPSGADVYVDGDRKGTTPFVLSNLCGGERDLLVLKQDVGSWSERVRLSAGAANTLDVRLRPTLVYLGTFRLDEWGRAVWSDQDAPLLDEINKGLKTLNVVRTPEVLKGLRESVIKWMISAPNEVRAGTILPPALLEEAASKARADLVLAGLQPAGDADKTWTMALYSVQHPAPDLVTLRTDRPEGARDLVRRLDAVPPVNAPWWGMGIVDTLLADPAPGDDGPLVVRVLPGGPAAKAGLKVGDRIASVGGRKTPNVRDVEQAIAAEMDRPGGVRPSLVLAVQGAGGARTVRFAPDDGPVVVPLSDSALLYNRALAEFRLRGRAATDELEKGAALLNLGVAFMHFRAFDKADVEGFARAALPAVVGVSQGTILYYRGLNALRRGNPQAARAAFQEAAAQTGSTLDTGDGPSAAAAATRLLQTLE